MKKYKETQIILNRIREASKILLALHRGSDSDSMGSNLALFHTLGQFKEKNVQILSSDPVPEDLSFLPGSEKIVKKDMGDVDLSAFDLFVSLDSSTPKMLTIKTMFEFPKGFQVIVIDHHFTNERYGRVNLVDDEVGSTAELLYRLFVDWKIKITEDIAMCLLTGILGDTANFKFGTTAQTLQIASDLVKSGASLNKINFNLYKNIPIKFLHFWGRILQKLKIEQLEKHKFGWAAVPYMEFKKFGSGGAREGVATMFFSSIKDTDFGLLMVEEKKGEIKGSLRSRTGIDVSNFALLFGGGGHKAAAGFRVLLGQDNFDDEVKEILNVIKNSLKKNKQNLSFLGKNDEGN